MWRITGILLVFIACSKKPDSDLRVNVNAVDSLTYVFIPAGEFLMGCVPGDTICWEEELPQHRETIEQGFWMSSTEVTVAAFRKFATSSGYVPESQRIDSGRMYNAQAKDWFWTKGLDWQHPTDPKIEAIDRYPVAQVSWKDAVNYCKWAGGVLPTERQWEYASRAGKPNELYPWGNSNTPVVDGIEQTNGPDVSAEKVFPGLDIFPSYDDGYVTYAPVGTFPANGFGLYDMSGNVWEWCADTFYYNAYDYPTGVTPPDSLRRRSKIVRGGSWCYYPHQQRLSERGAFETEHFWTASLGFRCVIDSSSLKTTL